MSKYIPALEFARKHGITKEAIYTHKKVCGKGLTKSGNIVYVDEEYFLRRWKFTKKIIERSQGNYYFITACIKEGELCQLLKKYSGKSEAFWRNFLSKDLFYPKFANNGNGYSVLKAKVYGSMWIFYRLTTALIREVFRKVGVPKHKRDYNKMWDYKYGKAA